ncbi:GDPGTP exchange factor Sec2p [Penicillium sp. DV-2018c]|nr:GDPGTP exchange factor Sec2p [Penicillium sp. DV-2018c]KAJ5563621.1 GDPGTP exchange factor Sec2p [Penicillium sp. DV-2018c]
MKTVAEKQCPMCWGEGFTQDSSGAQNRIQELEGQVQALTARASATATICSTVARQYRTHGDTSPSLSPSPSPDTRTNHDRKASKLSEYEEELRRLRSSQPQTAYDTPRSSSSLGGPPSQPAQSRPTSSESQPQTYHSRLTNLASLLPYRRGSAAPPPAPMAPDIPTTPVGATHPTATHTSPASSDHHELQDALMREQDLRKAAETQLSQASTELEELTVQLFSQANEMVAEERRARAKLEERVAVLERRDLEKRKRLEKLENAIARVERLRALVNHQ